MALASVEGGAHPFTFGDLAGGAGLGVRGRVLET